MPSFSSSGSASVSNDCVAEVTSRSLGYGVGGLECTDRVGVLTTTEALATFEIRKQT